MWQVIRNTTFHTITLAVAVAMGIEGNWDCMPLTVCVAHWTHKADSWFRGIHVRCYTAFSGVRTGSYGCETSLWNLEPLRPFIIAAAETIRPLFFIRCSHCSSGENHSSWSHVQFFFFFSFLRWRSVTLRTWFQPDLVSEECIHSVAVGQQSLLQSFQEWSPTPISSVTFF